MTFRDSQNVAAGEGAASASPAFVRTDQVPPPGSSAAALPLHHHPNAVAAARRADPVEIYLDDGSIIQCELTQLEGDNAMNGYWVKSQRHRPIIATLYPYDRVRLIVVGGAR